MKNVIVVMFMLLNATASFAATGSLEKEFYRRTTNDINREAEAKFKKLISISGVASQIIVTENQLTDGVLQSVFLQLKNGDICVIKEIGVIGEGNYELLCMNAQAAETTHKELSLKGN